MNQTNQDLIKFHHGTLLSPAQSTLVKVIHNRHIPTWPGLDESIVTKYLPPSLNTAKGHPRQERQHLQSTKPSPSPDEEIDTVKACLQRLLKKKKDGQNLQQVLEEDILEDTHPPLRTFNVKTHDIVCHIIQLGTTNKLCTDLTVTGFSPYRSL